VIESCHIAEGSESGAEFRETTPIREINGTKKSESKRYHQVEVDLARYIGALRIACGGAACAVKDALDLPRIRRCRHGDSETKSARWRERYDCARGLCFVAVRWVQACGQ
jgi:hypothetical protein